MHQIVTRTALVITLLATLGGCSPEIGSEAWCQKMEDTPTGDWSGNQATDYARHCLLK